MKKPRSARPWTSSRLAAVFAGVFVLVEGFGDSTHASPRDEISALIAAAQGTYPAAQLPRICVSIHPNVAPSQNLALLQKLGAHCARSDNNWDVIEKQPALYDWGSYDTLWAMLCRAGIKPIMIAAYNNPLYAAGVFRPIAGGPDIAAFQNFAVAMANHYVPICPDLTIELFNEPNAINWTTTPWTGTSYALMLAPVSSALKKAQPRVKVYSGGLGFDPGPRSTAWISQMVGAGPRFPAVDAYAFHPYNYDEAHPANTLPPEQVLVDTGHFAQAAKASGQGKPIAITEYGFPLPALDGDLRRQAIYAARGLLAVIIGQYPLTTYYDLIDDGIDDQNRENTFGLFRNGAAKPAFEIKPAGVAFATIMDAMAKASAYTVDFDAAKAAPVITFEKQASQTIVLWTYDRDATKSIERPVGPFRQVSCKDVFGKAYPCHFANGVLGLTLSEANGPILVTGFR